MLLLLGSISLVNAHVPFLKPNQFIVLHNRLQIESSYTEYPFQADYAMSAPYFALFDAEGKRTDLLPTAKTRVAQYLEPQLTQDGNYRVHAGQRKGPLYTAVETKEGKLYFAKDTLTKQGTLTKMQYYSSADTYILKGKANYQPQLIGEGVEIIPLSNPNALH